MERLRFLYLALLLTGAVLEVEAQQSFFDKVKNFFSMTFDDIKVKFEQFKTTMGERFDTLSEKLRNFFNNQDFSKATAADVMNELRGDDWKKMEPAMLMSMPKTEAEKMVSLSVNRQDIPKRFTEELRRLLVLNMTDAEVAEAVRIRLSRCTSYESEQSDCELNVGERSALLQRLGTPDTWTRANITTLGAYLLRVPVCFDDAKDETVLQGILDLVNNCDTSNAPLGCPPRSELDDIRMPLTLKLSGAIKDWQMSDVERMMPSYSDIPPFAIRHTSDKFVTDMKAKLRTATLPSDFTPELEAWMMEICRVDDCSSKSAADTKAWYDGLGNLKTYVTPSDVSAAAMEDATLAAQLEANAKRKEPMRAKDTAILLDMKLDKAEPATISELGGRMASWAPACYLWQAAERRTLSPVRPQVASYLYLQRGPEHMAKVNATLRSNMQVALTGNSFRVSQVSNYLRPFISPDYMDELSSGDVLTVAKVADENFIQPEPFQMHLMVKGITTTDAQAAPAILKERLPVAKMVSGSSTVGSSTLVRLDEGMLGVTLPCLLGAKQMFTAKNILRPADIANGRSFLKCMSFDDASKVNSSDIFRVFEEILDEDLSWSACRAFEQKLTQWARNNLNIDDTGSVEDVVNGLYVNEIYKIPACVFIAYEPVIYNMDMQVKKAVLNNLCGAKNYFSIPRDARRRVINTLIPQTMNGPITVCGIRRIGYCFVDLDRNQLRQMDEGATVSYITNLELFLKKGVPVCLDSGQRDEVAEMVLEMKGPAAKWKTAGDVSCILDTLSSGGIDRIAAEVPAEVLITTECPVRDYTFNSMPPMGSCMQEIKDAQMRMKNRKVEKCVRLRETYGTNNSTCDAALCGNILRMTSSQLERMDKMEVVRLLESLTTEDLDRQKAQVVLAKLKEVKPLQDMSVAELERVKHAWRGLSKEDVMNLPQFTSEHRVVLYHLGMATDLPDDVMMALKEKILDFNRPSNMRDETDVFLLGGLMCYLSENEVNAIDNEFFVKQMRNLGVRECNNATTTYYLAMKGKAAYREMYGKDPQNWDAALVYEFGVLVGGLRPEDLDVIPEEAFVGFTAAGISKIDTEAIKVMDAAQASNLAGPTAAAITSDQEAAMSGSVRLAIYNARSGELRNSASGMSAPRVLAALTTALLLLLL